MDEPSSRLGAATPAVDDCHRLRELFDACIDVAPATRESILSAAGDPDDPVIVHARRLIALFDSASGEIRQDVLKTADGLRLGVELTQARLEDRVLPLTRPRNDVSQMTLPKRFGRFTLLQCIGRGATSQVYKARQHDPERDVAIKILDTAYTTPGQLTRFRREADVLARLTHPGVACVYEAGQEIIDGEGEGENGPRPYIAMELVPGQRITEFVVSKKLSIEQCVKLIIQACRAVAHAHAAKVIHRDLKPANIMAYERVGDEGAVGGEVEYHISILDFGVAKLAAGFAGSTHQDTLFSVFGSVFGTIAYLSPEQVRPGGEPDIRSDVYALGLVLYELLAGRALRNNLPADALAAIRLIANQSQPDLSGLPSSCGRELFAVVNKSLHAEPAQRYQSAEELANDLERYIRGEGVHARTRTPIGALSLWACKYPRSAAILGMGLAAMCIMLVLLAQAQSAARKDADIATQALTSMVNFASSQSWIKGTAEIRRATLQRAEELLATRNYATTSDPSVLYALARLNLALFDQSIQPSGSDRQHLYVARKYYELALARPPVSISIDELNREYTNVLIRCGDVFQHAGEWARADEEWIAAQNRLEKAWAANPHGIQESDDLVWGYIRLLQASLSRSHFQRADDLLVKLRVSAANLRKISPPSRSLTLWALMHVENMEAITVQATGDELCEVQLPFRLRAVQLGVELCDKQPDNREYLYLLVHTACSAAEAAATQMNASNQWYAPQDQGSLPNQMLAVAQSALDKIGDLELQDARYWQLHEKIGYAQFTCAKLNSDVVGMEKALTQLRKTVEAREAQWPQTGTPGVHLENLEGVALLHGIELNKK